MRSTFSLALILSAACDAPATDESIVELGRLEFFDDPVIINVPSSVKKRQPFQVQVVTYGGGCISFERTDVQVAMDGVDFLPYDRRDIPANGLCFANLSPITHEEYVVFDEPGRHVIRIHGRRYNARVDEPIVIQMTTSVEL
ncbi:MAG: hypothetical protein H0T42_21865 [Deltaproteobacteria bacterium]|nr:hypothetical protein [Deltaproteobacteria bacterium]